MNTGNELLDCQNEIEMRYDKYLILKEKWGGWYIIPTTLFKSTIDRTKKKFMCLSCLSYIQIFETWLRQVVL